jgi:hypothetical protein
MSRRLLAPILVALFALAAALPATASAWAPADSATVHPGVQTYTDGSGQCTSNFIFTQGADVFIGQSAHCSGTGAATDTNGCDAESLPLGTRVQIDGASVKGTMVYNSWIAMQQAGETDEETCAYNDFALVKVDPADFAKVNPSLPHWGGPRGINNTGTAELEPVFTVGNSGLRQGIGLLMPKSGISLGTSEQGWVHQVYTLTPGIPGDSGSAMVNSTGLATGILSTIEITPVPASNLFIDLAKAMKYAQSHGMPGLRLGTTTVAFNPNQLPLGLGL